MNKMDNHFNFMQLNDLSHKRAIVWVIAYIFYRLRSKTNSSLRPTIIRSKVISSAVLNSTIFKSTQKV